MCAAVQALVHRRALPIASPCQVFRPSPGQSFCDHCSTHVHDLSAMTRKAAEALLAANDGRKMCVAYRTKADGTLVHRPEPRPEPRPLAVAALALGLAACTGHTPEVEYPGEHCRDPQGYEHECEDARHGGAWRIPDADAVHTGESRQVADADVEAGVDPVIDPEAKPAIARNDPAPPSIMTMPEIDESDYLSGLVSVSYVPEVETETLRGEIVVDASETRKGRRAEKRAERRARRGAR